MPCLSFGEQNYLTANWKRSFPVLSLFRSGQHQQIVNNLLLSQSGCFHEDVRPYKEFYVSQGMKPPDLHIDEAFFQYSLNLITVL